MTRLFHVSDVANIGQFVPRPSSSIIQTDAVWAIDEEHLVNYLLPRDCPRVCCTSNSLTSTEDRDRYIGASQASRIIAVEWNWLDRIRSEVLYVYEFSTDSFELLDANAGYWVSKVPCEPTSVTTVDDVLSELGRRNVELRFMTDLWPFHNAIATSSLEFSMIRMRNTANRLV